MTRFPILLVIIALVVVCMKFTLPQFVCDCKQKIGAPNIPDARSPKLFKG